MDDAVLFRLLNRHGTVIITKADNNSGYNVESAVPVPNTSTFQSTEWLGHGFTPEAALTDAEEQ
jgi:hypothetical protein